MSPPMLNDAQIRAIKLKGHDLLVTAGAGTGKTTVLVERAVYKLRTGDVDSLDRLLVVTFTDKAAKEMKNRLYREMLQDPSLRRFLPQLPRAWISTIHGFCGRLLRERFLEAGVEPGFRVLSEHGQEEAFDDALRRVFHSWYRRSGLEEGRRFISLVEMAGFDAEGEVLRKIVRKIHDFSRVTPDPEAYLESLLSRPEATSLNDLPWYGEMADALFGRSSAGSRPVTDRAATGAASGHPETGQASDALWPRALSLYRAAVDLAAPKNPEKMRRFLGVLEAADPRDLRTPEGQASLLDALSGADIISEGGSLGSGFPTAARGAKTIPGFKDLHEAARSLFRDTALARLPWSEEALLREDGKQREFLHVLVRIVREVDRLYAQYKSRHGYLDFSDLEIHAARLIRDHGARLGWPDRFSEVLVDEFQDVNPLQDGILSAFCRPDAGFRVGDVKQSIYQFRLADPTIFINRARSCRQVKSADDKPGSGEPAVLFLGDNYRSRPEILGFVNHLFAGIFDDAVIGSGYEEQALRPGRKDDQTTAPVELHLLAVREPRVKDEQATDQAGSADGGSAPADSPPSDAAVEFDRPDRREAVFTAQRIRRLIEDEHVEIPESDGRTRRACYSDVAILLRGRGKADLFLQALEEAGVPAYRQEGGSLVQEEGVRDLRALLSVIDNPRDDVALAAVLRSPLVGISDEDLVRIRLAWPRSRTFLDAVTAVAYADDPDAATGVFTPPAPRPDDAFHADDQAAGDPSTRESQFWTGPPGDVPDDWIADSLRVKLRGFMDSLAVWRREQGGMELCRFIGKVCAESGLDSVLPGRPDPSLQRVAVERFISIARQYEAERWPSLHGFLARISLQETAGTLDGVSRSQEGQNAVALITVHKAKGLEFPIVILPQLHWRFRRDGIGDRIRVGERWIGLRELDFESWGRRDTWPRLTLELIQERRKREEEARILYVALTRARERLILVATPSRSFTPPEDLPPAHVQAFLARERRLTASSALDWILASIPWQDRLVSPERHVALFPEAQGFTFRSLPLLIWSHPAYPQSQKPQPEEEDQKSLVEWKRRLLGVRSAGIDIAAGPADEDPESPEEHPLSAGTTQELAGLLEKVSRETPHAPLADLDDLKGKYWVTELKNPMDRIRRDDLGEEGGGLWIQERASGPFIPAPAGSGSREDQAAAGRRGTVYHTALSRLDLSAVSPRQLEAQFDSMCREPWWEEVAREPVIEDGIARFFATSLGIRLRNAWEENREAVEREAAFSLRFPVRDLALLRPELASAISADHRWSDGPWAEALDHTWILVQGRIDCVFRENGRWTLIDWKTDRVKGPGLDERVALYSDQMRLYSRAVESLWGPLSGSWLVFPVAGRAVEVSAVQPQCDIAPRYKPA